MNNNYRQLIIVFLTLILFSSCADVQPNIEQYLTGHTYGFWGGLWHGLIVMPSFIGSLFSDDIAVWAINNNGAWYRFGFVLGCGGFGLTIRVIRYNSSPKKLTIKR